MYFEETKTEKLARRLLRVKKPLPDPTGIDFVPVEGKNAFVLEEVSKEEQAKRLKEWHEAPRRIHVAFKGIRKGRVIKHRFEQYVEDLKQTEEPLFRRVLGDSLAGKKINNKIVEHLLQNSRTLVFKSSISAKDI